MEAGWSSNWDTSRFIFEFQSIKTRPCYVYLNKKFDWRGLSPARYTNGNQQLTNLLKTSQNIPAFVMLVMLQCSDCETLSFIYKHQSLSCYNNAVYLDKKLDSKVYWFINRETNHVLTLVQCSSITCPGGAPEYSQLLEFQGNQDRLWM